jgi:hypothetical protein
MSRDFLEVILNIAWFCPPVQSGQPCMGQCDEEILNPHPGLHTTFPQRNPDETLQDAFRPARICLRNALFARSPGAAAC